MEPDGIHEGFKYQILWNSMGSDDIHEVLSIKSNEIQWNSMMILLTQAISNFLWFRVAYY